MSTSPTSIVGTLKKTIDVLPGRHITLDDLMAGIGQRSFGVLLLALSLPATLPVPGLAILFGAVLLLLGVQMLLGCTQPWLPQRVAQRAIPKPQLLKVLARLQKPLDLLNPYIHRRLPGLVRGKGERLAGLMVIVLALIVMVPLPLTNVLPAFCLVLTAIAFIQQDGLLALLSHLFGLLAIWLVYLVYGNLLFSAYNAWL